MTSFDTDSTRPPPNIPEFASFEHQKENIVPLRQGRSAALLAHQFSAPSSDLSAERASVHAHFADELAHLDDLDDPLDVFSRYIRWTLEAYPQGPNHESNLVPLLEQVTRKFKNERRYKNDPRYLRCWLLYANYVEEPKDIFVFLMRNDIGTDLAALYEDYALLLEKMGR
ncbi:Mad3/BUB1 homology region 1-domain-containing protein [Jimgerdemannia flammicorona]|uniref:Mad3/BUB1 homology region 1-domain-containing protein n=1 Tax=Jimgerdemannia flammicorona TaxID=994334 RepID=A0A433QMN3_9FUNG|nr:Mad3/BUB1 homology region 1-domain-containing protein [Jimgerdemannia flammicorona]